MVARPTNLRCQPSISPHLAARPAAAAGICRNHPSGPPGNFQRCALRQSFVQQISHLHSAHRPPKGFVGTLADWLYGPAGFAREAVKRFPESPTPGSQPNTPVPLLNKTCCFQSVSAGALRVFNLFIPSDPQGVGMEGPIQRPCGKGRHISVIWSTICLYQDLHL